ncbi:RNA polymerase sigma factor SigM [Nocardioides sp. YIM 152588]|uniref:RNA polymerase sigma factor SigM n=1 Tax=Nocardioides sp. YIM 152588 TaxID=3158259 RepID=UPI0032E52D26
MVTEPLPPSDPDDASAAGVDVPPDEPADADLLAAHVAGDAEAFGVLFRRHRERLWAVALRTTGDPETAADGLQDGMVAAFRRAGSFRGEAKVTTWLHRVVVNACLDRLRAAKVRRAEPLPDQLDDQDRLTRAVAVDADGDPLEQHLRSERRSRVLAALATLPLEQRAALVLVDMEGYPVAEAAAILDCAVGTVKSRCSRARGRLADQLADLLGDLDDEGEQDHAGRTAPGRNPATLPHVGAGGRRGPPGTTPAPTSTP